MEQLGSSYSVQSTGRATLCPNTRASARLARLGWA